VANLSRQPAAGSDPAADHSPADRQHTRSTLQRYLPWLLGALTGLVVCILGLLVLVAIQRQSPPLPSPTSAAAAICTDLRAADYASLYQALSPALQLQGANSEAEFTASQRQLDIISGQVSGCSYRIQQPGGTQANVTYLIARGSKPSQPAQVVLAYLNGAWRIQQYDTSLV
jgi:hypothetical protein